MSRPRVSPPDVIRPISFGIAPDMLERLDVAARSERVPRSVLLREMVEAGLARIKGPEVL